VAVLPEKIVHISGISRILNRMSPESTAIQGAAGEFIRDYPRFGVFCGHRQRFSAAPLGSTHPFSSESQQK
jgi:hypothetical protein